VALCFIVIPAMGDADTGHVRAAREAGKSMEFVVVGGGLAGHRAVVELRKIAPASRIVLIGAETGLPYDRPPLSKAFLTDGADAQTPTFTEAAHYRELGIEHHPQTRIVAIDRVEQRIHADDGRVFAYDRLLIATGSRVRTLPAEVIGDAPVHLLRTLDDARRLRAALASGRRVTVIGGGLIGLEIAAAANARGCRVTVVERERRLLSRGLPAPIGEWALQLHRRHGVGVMLGANIERIQRDGEEIEINLDSCRRRADVVVVGIGVRPNCELASAAGLDVDDGIRVDRSCRTSDPNIFAAGEVTAHPLAGRGPQRRIESWKVASEQALVAAQTMAGAEADFDEVPWFWSDQFDVNIQALGQPDAGVRYLLCGDAAGPRWTLIGLDGNDRPVGAVAVNNGRDISQLRRAMSAGQEVPPALLRDAVELPVGDDELVRGPTSAMA